MAAAAATAALALVSTIAATSPVAAAVQTASCTDGAQRLWKAKATWGSTSVAADGTTRVSISSLAWSTNAQTLKTQVEVKSYQPNGRLLQTLTNDQRYDYNAGTAWFKRNPMNPVSGPGKARVTLKVGLHGTADCIITFTQPSSAPVREAGTGSKPIGVPGGWQPAFGDEFNGTAVDTAKWNPAYCKTMNKTLIDRANTTVANGIATLRLKGGKGAMLTSSSVDGCGGTSNNYTLPVGGYAEARVKFPSTSSGACANWPAWWASGPNWPAAGEHDIAEILEGKQTANYHSPTANIRTFTGSASAWCGSWHVYGAHRRAQATDLYWDGKKVATYSTSDNGAGQSLILNIGVHSSHTDVTKPLLVDYVRAWKAA